MTLTLVERAKDYQNKGWFTNMTSEQIENEILELEQEILRVDKRTYNGKMTRTFNKSKIAIAKCILEALIESTKETEEQIEEVETNEITEETKEENTVERTITNNEILFTCKPNVEGLGAKVLHKQSYSDDTCFYSLQDRMGNWKVDHGNRDLNKLIKQMEHELKINQEYKETEYIMENEEIRKVYEAIEQWNIEIINKMKEIISNEVSVSTPIVVDFKNILSELELKKIKLCFLKDGGLFIEDNQNNLYQMEVSRQGSYLDRLIKDGITVNFYQVEESLSKNVEDWRKEIWDVPEVESFIYRHSL